MDVGPGMNIRITTHPELFQIAFVVAIYDGKIEFGISLSFITLRVTLGE